MYRNDLVPLLLWTGKLKEGWRYTQKKSHTNREQIVSLQTHLSSLAAWPGCWWMAPSHVQPCSQILLCYLKVFLWGSEFHGTLAPPNVGHIWDISAMKDEEQGHVLDPEVLNPLWEPWLDLQSPSTDCTISSLWVSIRGFLCAKASKRIDDQLIDARPPCSSGRSLREPSQERSKGMDRRQRWYGCTRQWGGKRAPLPWERNIPVGPMVIPSFEDEFCTDLSPGAQGNISGQPSSSSSGSNSPMWGPERMTPPWPGVLWRIWLRGKPCSLPHPLYRVTVGCSAIQQHWCFNFSGKQKLP